MAMKKTGWSDLSPGTRTLVSIGAAIQLLLLALSHWDLSRRSSTEVRGAKGMWRVVTLINFIGPLMYFTFGRRKR